MAIRFAKEADTSKLFTLRIGNIPDDLKSEQLLDEFKVFGVIGDFYRPFDLSKNKPSRFAFVRFFNKEDADIAMRELHGKKYEFERITVHEANQQDSFFTQDTGFITNEMFDFPKLVISEFDSSLPDEYYLARRRKQLENVEKVYSIRIDDLHHSIGKEKLLEICENFGEISSIYLPMDLKERKHKGFAFARYVDLDCARSALQYLDNTNLGVGRNIRVSMEVVRDYFSQDESVPKELDRHYKWETIL